MTTILRGTGVVTFFSTLTAFLVLAVPTTAQEDPDGDEEFYRKGTAPPGELCPIFCEYRPCCIPPD